MSFKRIIVFVMTLVMVVSACVPALNVFATDSHDHDHKTETKTELDYVSFGDSVASGLGLDGYNPNGHYMGLPSLAPESFPTKFAAWLAGSDGKYDVKGIKNVFNGDKGQVNLIQLALNYARVEDVLYFLSQDMGFLAEMNPEELANEIAENSWTYDVVIEWGGKPSDLDTSAWAALLAGTYQDAVEGAEVITLGLGNANFNEYLATVVTGGDKYDYMTLESASKLIDVIDDEDIKVAIAELYNETIEVLKENDLYAEDIEKTAGRVAYVVASYLASYDKLVKLIAEINPEVEIVIVPVVEAFSDFDYLVDSVNAGLAAILTVEKGMQEYDGVTIYYTDIEGEVELSGDGEIVIAPTAEGHTAIADAIIEAYSEGYKIQDETIENIKEIVTVIAGLVGEYYDDAYAYGYDYINQNGYITIAANALLDAIEAVEIAYAQVDAGLLGLNPELEAKMLEELQATINTLKELYEVLDKGLATDVDGFVKVVFGLEDDLYTHLANIYAILEQGAIDVNQEWLYPGFVKAVRVLHDDILPKVDAMLQKMVDAAVDYAIEKLYPYHIKANEIFGITLDVFNRIVDISIRVNAFVEDNKDEFIEICVNVVGVLTKVYGNIKHAVNVTIDIYEFVIDFVETHEEEIAFGIDLTEKIYNGLVDILKTVYGERETIEFVAGQVYIIVAKLIEIMKAFDINDVNDVIDFVGDIIKGTQHTIEVVKNIVKFIINNRETIENGIISIKQGCEYLVDIAIDIYNTSKDIYYTAIRVYEYLVSSVLDFNNEVTTGINNAANELLNIIIYTYTTTKDAYYTAVRAYEYIVSTGTAINNAIKDMLYDAVNGSYELTYDSMYVALGNSPFAEELAGKLNLAEKYVELELNGEDDYLKAVSDADLVTIKVDSDEFYGFASKQVNGTIATVVRDNKKLMELYQHPMVGGYVQSVVEEFGIDVEAQTEVLDWSKYLHPDDQVKLEKALVLLRAELISRGIPEYYYIDLQPLVDRALEENGLAGLPGITITMDPIEVPVADIAVYAIESALYAYARYMNDLGDLLDGIYEASPEATVVLLGISNPLVGLELDFSAFGIDCIDFEDCYEASKVVIKTFNAHLFLEGCKNDNTIFVLENDADAIYNALHAYCNHDYDDCLDTICNICGEERVAPGHSFTNYVFNNNSTCSKEGTETAKCDNCDATHTRTAVGSKKEHSWKNATCTAPKTCRVCGTTQGTANGHKWVSATCTEARTCSVCKTTQGDELGHNFTKWVELEEATRKSEGLEERTCKRCGIVETRIIPVIPPKHTVGEIVATIIAAIAFAIATSAIVLRRLRKKDILKK